MMLTTTLTETLKIPYPIIQAPMAGGATTPELIAAVSNAGGLGSLGAGYMKPNDLRQAIDTIRQLTDKPFAVNLFIPEKHHATDEQIQLACQSLNQVCPELNLTIEPATPPFAQDFEEQMQVIIEKRVPIFSFTFGLLSEQWLQALKNNNTWIIGSATTLAEAKALVANGVDMICAQGSEAGGHRGSFLKPAKHSLIGLCSLIPQLVDHINLPIIAAGGIMDGRGINAALTLGASGVQMGSAFLTCSESGIHAKYKQALLNLTEDNTCLTRAFSGRLARGINNTFTQRMQSKQATLLEYPIQNALTRGMRQHAKAESNPEFMSLWAGQAAYLSRNMAAADLIMQLVKETMPHS